MRHKNITFSIPEDLKSLLQASVNKRGLSKFITDAIRKALEEERLRKEQELDAAYEASNQDFDRLDALRDWNALDDVTDLSVKDDDEDEWNWLKKLNQ